MKYTIVITMPTGPTILDDDQVPVTITRMAGTPEQVTAMQKAAVVLGASKVEISENRKP